MTAPWKPHVGMQVEVELRYPEPVGSAEHTCRKVGTVVTLLPWPISSFAKVEFIVDNKFVSEWFSFRYLQPCAPLLSHLSTEDWALLLLELQHGDAVDVLFREAWCRASFIIVPNQVVPQVFLHGHLHFLGGAEIKQLRRSMTFESSTGTWSPYTVPEPLQLLLTCKEASTADGDLQDVPRRIWKNVSKLSATANNSSSTYVVSCQPPLPAALPFHVPTSGDDAALPVYKAESAAWTDSSSCAASYSQALAARMSDVALMARGLHRNLNFTPEQWQLVTAYLQLPDSLVQQVDCVVPLQHPDALGKRTHAAAAGLQDNGTGNIQQDGVLNGPQDAEPVLGNKRMRLHSKDSLTFKGVTDATATPAAAETSIGASSVMAGTASDAALAAATGAAALCGVTETTAAAAAAGAAVNTPPASDPQQLTAGTAAAVAEGAAVEAAAAVSALGKPPLPAAAAATQGAAVEAGTAATAPAAAAAAASASGEPKPATTATEGVQPAELEASAAANAAAAAAAAGVTARTADFVMADSASGVPPAAATAAEGAQGAAAETGATNSTAAAVAAAAAAAAAAALAPKAKAYEFLPAGIELNIDLSQLTVKLGEVTAKKMVGSAKVKLLKLLGSGGLCDAYLAQLLSHGHTAGSSRKRPPEQLVAKIVHPPDVPLPTEKMQFNYLKFARLMMWQEHTVLQDMADCPEAIDSFGYGMASRVGGKSFYGFARYMACIMLEYADLGDVWHNLWPNPTTSVPMSALATRQLVHALVRSLSWLHRKGWIHRELAPTNVLMFSRPGSSTPVWKLADFGMAVRAADEIKNNFVDGTDGMRAPDGYYLHSYDTYSLGRLVLCCRGGGVPPEGTFEEIFSSGIYQKLAEPLTEAEWDLLRVCLRQYGCNRPRPESLLREVPTYANANFT